MAGKDFPRGAWAVCFLFAASPGCVLGPGALQASRTAYNEVIQRTTNEQLLLNLVRLQYREAPLFLEVGSVAAQFTFEESADIGGTINENIPLQPLNPDILRLGAKVGYQERPTITYLPLQGEDFAQRMLAPLRLDTIILLTRSGWSIDRVLRLTVQGMNGLDNASGASGPTPSLAPRFEEFVRVSRAFRSLQQKGLLEIGYELTRKELSAPIAADALDASDLIEAARAGYEFKKSDDGEGYVLSGSARSLVWRIPSAAAGTPEVRDIVDALGLEPERGSYGFRAATGEGASAESAGKRTYIDVATRSLMGTFFYLSQAISVPEDHREDGVVTTTLDAEGAPFDWTTVTGDLLRVHSRALPPGTAAVAVRFRGHWFYIRDSDLGSKSTFGLLGQLFALQAGAEGGAAPVLTLSVGG